MKISFELQEKKLHNEFEQSRKRARLILKSEIVKDTEPFVPFRVGYVARSVMASVSSNDPYIIYKTPYARFLYYGKVMVGVNSGRAWAMKNETKVTTGKNLTFGKAHPQAQARWFEASKKVYIKNWLEIVRKEYDR